MAALAATEAQLQLPNAKRRGQPPALPHRTRNLHELRDGHRLKPARATAYAAFDELFNSVWPPKAAGRKRNEPAASSDGSSDGVSVAQQPITQLARVGGADDDARMTDAFGEPALSHSRSCSPAPNPSQ